MQTTTSARRLIRLRSLRKQNQGFTLVEISIVLVIIGLILGGILNAQSVIRNAQTKDSIKALNDMAAATRQFNDRYGLWPGDYRNAGAAAVFPTITAFCVGVATAGVPNGLINNNNESRCASEELIASGMLKGTIATAPAVTAITLRGATFSVIASANSGLPVATWGNVVRVQNIDCDIAVQMDRAVDDGNTNTGNFRTTANVCGATGTSQAETIPVPIAVFRLN
jgi:prepilin-type N-terminal cleavage/methylation domain-containing protein